MFWQVWLCGGSVEVIPCSKIAHIERAVKPYLPDLSVMMKRNALRVAEVWFDEYKYNVNIAWNLPLEVRDKTLLITQIRLHEGVFRSSYLLCGLFHPDVSHRIMG